MNNSQSRYIFDPLDQASLICFGDISVIKVSGGKILRQHFKHICLHLLFIGEILRLYFKHICVLLLLSVFPGNYYFAVRVNHFGPYSIIDPLD